jgi:hypothetical protein
MSAKNVTYYQLQNMLPGVFLLVNKLQLTPDPLHELLVTFELWNSSFHKGLIAHFWCLQQFYGSVHYAILVGISTVVGKPLTMIYSSNGYDPRNAILKE